jgi:hypothetical protein
MNASNLLEDLRRRDVTLVADGGCLHVDAPAGAITNELRAALVKNKGHLLELLACERRNVRGARRRGLAVRWSEYPTWIRLHDPTTGEWHEVRASECLPRVVETADRCRRIGG